MSIKASSRKGSGSRGLNAEPYDFRRPMTLARDHARALEVSFETYARQWSMQLTSRLRVLCSITMDSLELTTYDEYISELDQQTVMALMTMDDSRPNSILQVSSKTAMLWIDYLLGGPGIELTGPARELTEIEYNLIVSLLGNTMTDLKYAFASVHTFAPAIRSIQYSPQFVQAVPAKEAVLVAHFTVTTNGTDSSSTIMVPADTLISPLRAGEGSDARSAAEEEEARDAAERLGRSLEFVPLETAVRFRPLAVHPRDVSALSVGEIVRLNHPVSKPLEVVAEDLLVARAVPGSTGNQLSCRIVSNELRGRA